MLKWLSGLLTTVLSGWILHDRLLHRLRSWSWHFLNSDISQGSVVMELRCGGIISQSFVNANLLMNLSVKEVWKSVNIWRSYGQYCSALFFLTHSVYRRHLWRSTAGSHHWSLGYHYAYTAGLHSTLVRCVRGLLAWLPRRIRCIPVPW